MNTDKHNSVLIDAGSNDKNRDRLMKKIQRKYYPGDEWLYIKIYCGIKTSENILLDYIYPLARDLKKAGIISKWFFIRYSDPDFHLRVRFLLIDINQTGTVINWLSQKCRKLIQSHYVHDISIATYVREIERYGGNLMEHTETLFYQNSECVCSVLKAIRQSDVNYRWMLAFKLTDDFFNILGIDLNAKIKLGDTLDQSYKREFGFTMYNSKQLNIIYRQHRKTICDILEHKIENEIYLKASTIIEKTNQQGKEVLRLIDTKDINISSMLHMMMNRMFASQNRLYELLIYNFLNRYYKSALAQRKSVL